MKIVLNYLTSSLSVNSLIEKGNNIVGQLDKKIYIIAAICFALLVTGVLLIFRRPKGKNEKISTNIKAIETQKKIEPTVGVSTASANTTRNTVIQERAPNNLIQNSPFIVNDQKTLLLKGKESEKKRVVKVTAKPTPSDPVSRALKSQKETIEAVPSPEKAEEVVKLLAATKEKEVPEALAAAAKKAEEETKLLAAKKEKEEAEAQAAVAKKAAEEAKLLAAKKEKEEAEAQAAAAKKAEEEAKLLAAKKEKEEIEAKAAGEKAEQEAKLLTANRSPASIASIPQHPTVKIPQKSEPPLPLSLKEDSNDFPVPFETLKRMHLYNPERVGSIIEKVNQALRSPQGERVPSEYAKLKNLIGSEKQLELLYEETKVIAHEYSLKDLEIDGLKDLESGGSAADDREFKREYPKILFANLSTLITGLCKSKQFPQYTS